MHPGNAVADMRRQILVRGHTFFQFAKLGYCRVNLAFFAFGGDCHKQIPQFGFSHKMVAPVAGDMRALNDAIALQFFQRIGHVGACQIKRITN